VTAAARFREFLFLLRARLALLAGHPAAARRVLKDAVRREPNSFRAHFALGRLYWGEHCTVKARREFDLAWQIDPERFERCYGRLKARHHGVPEVFSMDDGARETATVVSPGLASRRAPGQTPGRSLLRGDFASEREARRFASMGPITREEIESIDWDRLESEFEQDGRA